ncbi:hypothetical protein TanjilG_16676 [Lupinus angustifolius]|uniref:Auxin response factor n=1 Tax=Lupinus angustifolius TaxID=3871 RepID=A0A4P1R007_LUPAN|nr:hypothetical protein TanjilG_16676 [Lupinus angustifolius]
MKVPTNGYLTNSGEGERKTINSELWHACAGPLVSLPPAGSLVVYFPQGHSEQVAASMQKEADFIPSYPNLPSKLICMLHSVALHADLETDEVYAQMTLQPYDKEAMLASDTGLKQNQQPTEFFCKTLTASDTSTHGGFSVPRRAAEKIFPPLLNAKIARTLTTGQPKRHLLTTGWSVFVSTKRLFAGDSVLFIRDEKQQLLLGIKHANRQQPALSSSVISSDSMHIGVLAAAAHAASNNSPFTIFYNPRASPSEFVIPLHADLETDEVYAQMTLQPVNKYDKEAMLASDTGLKQNQQPTEFFCKTLTASDTSTHGGFSVPRRAAEKIFPPLDFSLQPPAQEIVAKDLHDNTWTFRHIYRGQPKRHLLTTGWSVFVSTKRLFAGDSVLFIRDEKQQLLLGIKHANRQQPALSSSVISSDSMHIGVLAAAAHAASNNSPFTIFYNPRASPSEFVIPLAKYNKALYTQVSLGMRFRMMFETEDSGVRRYMGTITGISDLDPARWKNSQWRNLQVGWDESTSGERPGRVSIWGIEPVVTPFYICPPPFFRLKFPKQPGMPEDETDVENAFKRVMPWLGDDLGMKDASSSLFPGLSLVQWMSMQQNNQFSPPQSGFFPSSMLSSDTLHVTSNQIPNQCIQQQVPYSQLQQQQLLSGSVPPQQSTQPVSKNTSLVTFLPQDSQFQHQIGQQANLLQRQQQAQMQQSSLQLLQQSMSQRASQQPQVTQMSQQSPSEQQLQLLQKLQQQQQQQLHSTTPSALLQSQFLHQQNQQLPQHPLSPHWSQQLGNNAFSTEKLLNTNNNFSSSLMQLQQPPANQSLYTHKSLTTTICPPSLTDVDALSCSTSPSDNNCQISPNFLKRNHQVPSTLGGTSVVEPTSNLMQELHSKSDMQIKHELSGMKGPDQLKYKGTITDHLEASSGTSYSIDPVNIHQNFQLPNFCMDGDVQSHPRSNLPFSSNLDGLTPDTLLSRGYDSQKDLQNLMSNYGSAPRGIETELSTADISPQSFGVRNMPCKPASSNDMAINDAGIMNNGLWANQTQRMRTYTKVQKVGSVGRCIDVTRYRGYDELRYDLASMFGIEGQLEDPQRTEWKLVYVDNENDILLVGDDPWEEFVSCVQSIKILSSAEVQQMSLDGDLGGHVPISNQACSGTESGNAWYDDNSAGSYNR